MISTEKFAAEISIKAQSIRAAVCRSGGYYGIKPTKLVNGRLLWPDDAAQRLTKHAKKGGAA